MEYAIISFLVGDKILSWLFHAKYGEFRAEVDIRTLQILNGDLPKRAKSMVLEWADEHRNELMHNWELALQNTELNAIEPLK